MKNVPGPVIFDLDGTLLDTAPDLATALNNLLLEEGFEPLTLSAVRSMVGQGAVQMIKKGFTESGKSPSEEELHGKLRKRFLSHYENCYLNETRPFPSVVTTLEKLKEAGHPMSICTNKSYEMSVPILDGLNLANYFHGVIGGNSLPTAKPDAAPLEAAIGLTNGLASSATMVGDSITDVEAARAAGIPVIAVSFGYTDIPPIDLGADAVIDNFSELIPEIKRLSLDRKETSEPNF
ncbi:MAG: phosphoglycolate phosphatase [Rhodospirillaceae bacterium]|nr:phosphoglycolate phosphatase [Rhodospirillaceae bacterium]